MFNSICELGISRIYLTRKPTFRNWMHHQANGSTHANEGIESFLNKNIFLMTSV
jgi:hypothetical protein